MAKTLAVWAALRPMLNWVMGCMSFGSEFNRGTTCFGNFEDRSCNSAVRPSTCSFVGTSDVSSSQIIDSRSGSPSPALPEKVGRT